MYTTCRNTNINIMEMGWVFQINLSLRDLMFWFQVVLPQSLARRGQHSVIHVVLLTLCLAGMVSIYWTLYWGTSCPGWTLITHLLCPDPFAIDVMQLKLAKHIYLNYHEPINTNKMSCIKSHLFQICLQSLFSLIHSFRHSAFTLQVKLNIL